MATRDQNALTGHPEQMKIVRDLLECRDSDEDAKRAVD